jgi:hypothetical protein
VGISGQTKITLSEAIERTLANDPDLRISRIQREEAGFSVRRRKARTIPCWPSPDRAPAPSCRWRPSWADRKPAN